MSGDMPVSAKVGDILVSGRHAADIIQPSFPYVDVTSLFPPNNRPSVDVTVKVALPSNEPSRSVCRPVTRGLDSSSFTWQVAAIAPRFTSTIERRVITVVTDFIISPHIHDANNNVLVLLYLCLSKTSIVPTDCHLRHL